MSPKTIKRLFDKFGWRLYFNHEHSKEEQIGLFDYDENCPLAGAIFYCKAERWISFRDDGFFEFTTISHILMDQVLPKLISGDGKLTMHGSLVAIGEHGLGFLGSSGVGKSTLAASFCRLGHQIVTDDCFFLEFDKACVSGSRIYGSLRLFSDSINAVYPEATQTESVSEFTSKRRIAVSTTIDSLPLKAFIRLGITSDEMNLTRLEPVEALFVLLENSFALDAGNRSEALRRFELAAMASKRVPVFDLKYPREFVSLTEVHDRIIQELDIELGGKQH